MHKGANHLIRLRAGLKTCPTSKKEAETCIKNLLAYKKIPSNEENE